MHNGKPDELDYRILQVLQQEARINLNKLASQIGLTVGPLTTRIEKMEAAGVIKKYMAIIDREKVNLPVLVLLMVKLKQQNTQLLDEFEALVLDMPVVLCCRNMSGPWNFILEVAAKTPQDYAVWLLEKVNSQPNVGNVESFFLMKECKSYGSFPLKP